MDKKLYLGVARKDITPEIGCNLYGYQPDVYSESIHDNLTVTAYVCSPSVISKGKYRLAVSAFCLVI